MRMRITYGLGVVVAGLLAVGTNVSAQDKAQVERGMKVYTAQKCGVCHSIAGKGAKKGPLDEVGSELTADQIREWIVNAVEMTKTEKVIRKPVMKNYSKLPKDDVDALVAYMLTLKKG